MGRYLNVIPLSQPADVLIVKVNDYLRSEGFAKDPKVGAWSKGGTMVAPQFIKVEPGPGGMVVEAWLKWAILPGVYAGEMGLDGFIAVIPKKMLKGRVEVIERILKGG
jgi:hypothetical protein